VLARYGSDQAWATNTLARLCDLDVFSLAAWTNGGVARFAGKLAYPASAAFLSTAPVVPGWPGGLTGVTPRDVFDPAWPAAATAYAASDPFIQRCQGDPWCYGVFVDNELPWGAGPLATGTHLDAYATLPAGSPAKLAVQYFFALRYRGDVAAFNAAWGLGVSSFDDLQARTSFTECPLGDFLGDDPCLAREPAARRTDRTDFDALVAARYARVVRDALRASAPAVLDLGMRFFSVYTPPAVARAVAPYVDVVSVNDYDFSPTNRASLRALGGGTAFPSLFSDDAFTDLGTLHALTGKPVLVGEWFYRERRPDAGPALPPLFPEVADQQEQAARYRVYARNLARMPFTVGQHWFLWMDRPKEGRADGENQLIGVVDIDDDLKVPLAAAMRTINRTLIQRHQRCVTRPNGSGC
jgi:agarase